MRYCKIMTFALLFTVFTAELRAELLYGLNNLQQLTTFDSVDRTVLTTKSITGFGITGESLLSIDVRPATSQLYALSSASNIYLINYDASPTTATASLIGNIPAFTGNVKAIDFNPTVDRIRAISSSGQDFRVHPDTGAVTTDGNLQFAMGDVNSGIPASVNVAYTNSFVGSTMTTLFNLESSKDILSIQNPPNNGTLNTVGPLGFDIVSSAGFTGFDISGQTDIAYLVGNKLGTGGLAGNNLYTVNLATGAATLLGPVAGAGGIYRDIAVVGPAPIPEPSTIALGILGLGCLAWRIRRKQLRA